MVLRFVFIAVKEVPNSPPAYCLLPPASCLLLTASCLLLTAYRLLPTAYCFPLTAYRLLPSALILHAAYGENPIICYEGLFHIVEKARGIVGQGSV